MGPQQRRLVSQLTPRADSLHAARERYKDVLAALQMHTWQCTDSDGCQTYCNLQSQEQEAFETANTFACDIQDCLESAAWHLPFRDKWIAPVVKALGL